MPENLDVSLEQVEKESVQAIKDFGGDVAKIEKEPIAFGLIALKIIFSMDEAKGATDPLEEKLKEVEGIRNVEVVDVRRAFG